MLSLISNRRQARMLRRLMTVVLTCLLIGLLTLPGLFSIIPGAKAAPPVPAGSAYRQTNLISDIPGLALDQDPLLVNPWGIAFRNASPLWIANNGSGTTQLVRGDVGGAPVVLNSSPQTINIAGGLPTGVVSNPSTTAFQITPPGGGTPASALFIFASDTPSGNITAWNGASGNATQTVVSMPGHAWTGLAISSTPGVNRLYAADFAGNHIDVFDGNFTATTVSGGFTDLSIPPGFAPFNIQNLGGFLYVTYAKNGGTGFLPVINGAGFGLVRKFDENGNKIGGFSIDVGGQLDAPWGLAIAPASFGIYGDALLVGNFSDNGIITAYNPTTGAPSNADNRLKDESDNPIVIDQLWSLQFGNGGQGGDVNTLYFTAGIADEEHGLFGKLKPTTDSATSLIQFGSSSFTAGEGSGHIDITVTRTGDTSGTATINYNTFDQSSAGHASQKSDYEISLGTLTFNPGETSKTFRILIVDDKFVEGSEVVNLALSNPTGSGVGLGSPNQATVTINDNDAAPTTANPLDIPSFFVRQHYLDFDNREPDSDFSALFNRITACGSFQPCINRERLAISSSFFNSTDFFGNGSLIWRTYRAAFGATTINTPAPVHYGEFELDLQALQKGAPLGGAGATQREANRVAYFNQFVARPEFISKYPSTLSNADYVDALLVTANLSPNDFIVNMSNSQEVPPTNPTKTDGTPRHASYGSVRFQLNAAQTALTVTGTVNNIDFTGSQTTDTNDNLTNAHIHAGPSVAPGVNGPVVWGFIGTPFNDNNPNDESVIPFGSGVGGTFSGKWDAPEGNGTTLAAQLDNLRNGRAYINFHTTQFGGGEIRGNIPATTAFAAFRDSLVAGLDGGTETRATVLRKVAEAGELQSREFNATFVTLEYFAYLRRDPDVAGFGFWLEKLISFNGDPIRAGMIAAFVYSSEYDQRFGANNIVDGNAAPDAVNDTSTTPAHTPVTINVLANDVDYDGQNVTLSSVTPGTGGTPSINGNSVVFTPDSNFSGSATFTYTITDGIDTDTATVTVTVVPGGTFQLSSTSYIVNEGSGRVTITVTRSGDLTVPVSVDFTTSDTAGLNPCSTVTGAASSRCDYEMAGGTLNFAAGESSKSADILIIDDSYAEGAENLSVALSNPKGTSFSLGTPATATVTITDNDSTTGPNPIDQTPFFVRQHYLDFLNREPDPAGFAAWVHRIDFCGQPGEAPPPCDRIEVSSAFFRSPEFYDRGYFVYRFYETALGRQPQYLEFMTDLRRVTGFLTAAELELRKQQFAEDFVNRPEFHSLYDSFSNGQPYVDAVLGVAGTERPGVGAATVVTSNRQSVIDRLAGGQITRGQALRELIEDGVIGQRFFNKAFVVMQYFGYLQRNPDALYLNWIQTLNQTGDYRTMVNGFMNSSEYRQRFGP